jgi:hypothetical protein
VSCVNSDFSDGYKTKVDRSNACYDTSKSVVIKIVDRWANYLLQPQSMQHIASSAQSAAVCW